MCKHKLRGIEEGKRVCCYILHSKHSVFMIFMHIVPCIVYTVRSTLTVHCAVYYRVCLTSMNNCIDLQGYLNPSACSQSHPIHSQDILCTGTVPDTPY